MTFLPQRHYANAPITEAVIDLTVNPEVGLAPEELGALCDESYPTREPLVFNQVQFSGGNTTTIHKPLGWRFRNGQGSDIYQARLNGFSASRLVPYQDWSAFRAEARRLWDRYTNLTQIGPETVTRLGLRYINRLDIPLPLDDFGDYLLTAPLVSPHLPQGLSNFLMSLTIPVEEFLTASVTEAVLDPEVVSKQALVPPVRQNSVSVLLDITVTLTNVAVSSDDQLWEHFDRLRKLKNHVFESCITEKTRELFQ